METYKVLTSLLVLTLTGPTLGYPYTRDVVSRSSGRARDQVMDDSLSEYLGGYVQDQPYELPEYQPAYRHEYATQQRPRINAEAIVALLPYLANNNDDYAYDYNSYSDDDGTWYDDVANEDAADKSDSDNAALLQFLLDHRSGRYSLEDLETLEREAEMEDNTENQLQALMDKKINKKSMPLLGARQVAVGVPVPMRKGQKEEALDIPSTSVRRPVFARQIATVPDEMEPQVKKSSEPINVPAAAQENSANAQMPKQATPAVSAVSSESSGVPVVDTHPKDVPQAAMTPFMQSKYDALMKYLDRERKVRQNQDIEQELQQETKSQPQKRFVTEQDVLSQQLVNLKKKVA
ncbi:uncharacterized protein LOC135204222 [Macrobrachium nipponense]|uniref:uncharacterized protein LOC135204222 n=1 Tax=Macrobrachium nipponense TaxID=159736 RepID=UPI0030C7CF81